MAFWDAYLKSLKPLEVEEPIDVYVHRPIAYLLARAALPTPVTPNAITLGSIAFGIAAGVCMVQPFPGHLVYAGLAIFLSAVFDCADGQLARLRGTSSAFGRMLDGCADLVVSTVVVAGGTYLVWQKFREPGVHGALAVALCVATVITGSFHTALYDHYKNLYLRFTHPSYREGEDYDVALGRYAGARASSAWWLRVAWAIYLFYLRSQATVIRRFDPYTWTAFRELPAYDARLAAAYRERAGGLMRLWRSFFGFGSLVFGMSASVALGIIEYYMLFRLVVLNTLFYAYMRPQQRRASRAMREQMARGCASLSAA